MIVKKNSEHKLRSQASDWLKESSASKTSQNLKDKSFNTSGIYPVHNSKIYFHSNTFMLLKEISKLHLLTVQLLKCQNSFERLE